MYRCHMQFYLVNCPPKVLETIADLPALEGFDHAFTSSREPKRELLARADVVLAVPTGGEEAVRALTEGGKPSAQLILLADKEQTAALGGGLALAGELWTLPLTDAELRFHFRRWQEKQKTRWDLWQTNQYLEATINSTPSLVWYKNTNGIPAQVFDAC